MEAKNRPICPDSGAGVSYNFPGSFLDPEVAGSSGKSVCIDYGSRNTANRRPTHATSRLLSTSADLGDSTIPIRLDVTNRPLKAGRLRLEAKA